MEPTETDLTLTTDDGRALAARITAPAGEARASVVIHGATATPRRYYDRFARWLAARGFRVLTYDYRGVGGSRPPALRGFDATMRDWAERDAVTAVRHLRAQFPDDPVLMVGHSFGGQSLGLSEALHEVAGAAMVGVQLGYVGHWPSLARARLALVWHLAFPAALALYGYIPAWTGIGEDLPGGVAREWSRWCRSPGYLTDFVPEARARFAAFRAPVLFYSFTDDDYAPGRAVRAYLTALGGAPVTHRRLRPADVGARAVGHFGFFRPDHADTLWTEVAGFFDDVLAGRPTALRATALALRAEAPSESDISADLAYGRE